jgi:Holliday junction resolvasome RuvABC endonuclease subunit
VREETIVTRVMGLDLSLTATGVALPDGTTYRVGGAAKDGDQRLVNITNMIAAHVQNLHVQLAVIEDVAPARAHRTINDIAMVHGCVRYALRRLNVPYAYLAPTTLKSYATGKGTADKRDMAVAAYKRAHVEFSDDNQCDAWWLRHAGLDWLGQPEIELPRAQRSRLDKGKWPTGLTRKGIT